jgi:hypothetical protein
VPVIQSLTLVLYLHRNYTNDNVILTTYTIGYFVFHNWIYKDFGKYYLHIFPLSKFFHCHKMYLYFFIYNSVNWDQQKFYCRFRCATDVI